MDPINALTIGWQYPDFNTKYFRLYFHALDKRIEKQ